MTTTLEVTVSPASNDPVVHGSQAPSSDRDAPLTSAGSLPASVAPVAPTLVTADDISQSSQVTGLMNASDRRFLRILLVVFLTCLAIEWVLVITRQPGTLHLERGAEFQTRFRVHINDAPWIDWMQLEGIGPALAHRIEAHRRIHGPFRTIEDLLQVPGIGPVTLERIRPMLLLESAPDREPQSAAGVSADNQRSTPR